MNDQNQIDSLVAHLRNEKLRTSTAEFRWERSSGTLFIRADFENGAIFALQLSSPTNAGTLRDLFQENLKARFAEECEFRDLLKLETGKRYTALLESEFGLGVHAIQFVLDTVRVGRFAQYAHCIDLIVKIKRKRDLQAFKFYGKKSFAIFDGWIEVNTDPFGPVDNSGVLPSRQSKYLSFDERYMTDAIRAAGVKPLCEKLFPVIRADRSAK
jgi:hypothetical protein